MNPQEKAKILLKQYKRGKDQKQNAIIVCNEVISVLSYTNQDNAYNDILSLKYWNKVKKTIEMID